MGFQKETQNGLQSFQITGDNGLLFYKYFHLVIDCIKKNVKIR